MIAARTGDAVMSADDRLDWRIIAALYVLPWIPLGPLVVIVGSSVGYYWLRKSRPISAKRLNRHAFVAFGLAVAFVVARRVLKL
jgi:hypothetical protein